MHILVEIISEGNEVGGYNIAKDKVVKGSGPWSYLVVTLEKKCSERASTHKLVFLEAP
jgi:hypothetical protein